MKSQLKIEVNFKNGQLYCGAKEQGTHQKIFRWKIKTNNGLDPRMPKQLYRTGEKGVVVDKNL